MPVPTDAKDFLARFAPEFAHEEVRGWVWGGPDDDDFGKAVSWDVQVLDPDAGQTIEANAAVDLQLTQITLSISERNMEEGVRTNTDSRITFSALVQFEDRTLTVDGVEREFTEAEIRTVIREFNERTR